MINSDTCLHCILGQFDVAVGQKVVLSSSSNFGLELALFSFDLYSPRVHIAVSPSHQPKQEFELLNTSYLEAFKRKNLGTGLNRSTPTVLPLDQRITS